MPRFVHYARKEFGIHILSGSVFKSSRSEPPIACRAIGMSLLLGEVMEVESLLQLQEETKLPQWQSWVGYQGRISDDAFMYASERMDPDLLGRGLAWINRKLKRGKGLEQSKVHGLLTASLDANEQFCS